MRKLKSFPGLLALVLLLVLALPVPGPGLKHLEGCALGSEWKNVTLLFTTDIKGKIEPCG